MKLFEEYFNKKTYFSFFLLIVISVIMAISAFLPIIIIEKMINSTIDGESKKYIILLGSLLLVLAIIWSLLFASYTYILNREKYRIGQNFYVSVFDKVLKVKIESLRNENSAEILNIMAEDSATITNNSIEPLVRIVTSLVTFFIGIIFVARVNVTILFIIIPLGLLTAFLAKRIQKSMQENIFTIKTKTSMLFRYFGEGIKGILTIRLNEQSPRVAMEVNEKSKEIVKAGSMQAELEAKNIFVLGTLYNIGIRVIIIVSCLLVLDDKMTIGGVIALSMYGHAIIDPLVDSFEYQRKYAHLKVALERIKRITNLPAEKEVNREALGVNKIVINKMTHSFKTFEVNVESLILTADSPMYITGESGSGKSTLAYLISGVYYSNQISYYCNNEIVAQDKMPKVRFAMQDEYIFDVSIEENIRFVNPSVSIEQIRELIINCKLESCLNQHGKNSVGENGEKLSGGERQRLRIARALAVENADIYIFDELTTGLDEEIARSIKSYVTDKLDGKILIFIEHDAVGTSNEQVVKLYKGKIVSSEN